MPQQPMSLPPRSNGPHRSVFEVFAFLGWLVFLLLLSILGAGVAAIILSGR